MKKTYITKLEYSWAVVLQDGSDLYEFRTKSAATKFKSFAESYPSTDLSGIAQEYYSIIIEMLTKAFGEDKALAIVESKYN